MNTIDPLLQPARSLYKDDGPNQWPHIQRVLNRAKEIAASRGKPLSDVERASIYLHDAAKANKTDTELRHGLAAAPYVDRVYGSILTPEQIQSVKDAIAAHDLKKRPPTPEGRLLKAADSNPPDLGWFLRKVYAKRINKGMTPEQAYQDIMDHRDVFIDSIKNNARYAKWGGIVGDQKKYRENLKQFKRLDTNQIKAIVEQYLKDNPNSSQFE